MEQTRYLFHNVQGRSKESKRNLNSSQTGWKIKRGIYYLIRIKIKSGWKQYNEKLYKRGERMTNSFEGTCDEDPIILESEIKLKDALKVTTVKEIKSRWDTSIPSCRDWFYQTPNKNIPKNNNNNNNFKTRSDLYLKWI